MYVPDSKDIVTKRWPRVLRGFSIEHLWALIVVAGVFMFVSTHPIRPHDFWWHAKIGEEIARTGRIPSVDTFSFTVPGKAYPSYQSFWLMELALYTFLSLEGSALVIFVHSLVITAAYGLLLWLCRGVSRSWRVAALCTLFAAALGLSDWNVRPQAIAPLLGVTLLWVVHYVRGKRGIHPSTSELGGSHKSWWWLALVFFCMLVWVNSHGSFVIGLVLLGIWLAAEVWGVVKSWLAGEARDWIRLLREPCFALLVAVLACLINPRGIGIVTYLATIGGDPVIQNLVTEWLPPSFNSLHGSLFFIGLLLSAAVLALSSRQPTAFQMLTFSGFAAFGLKTLRGVIWFGIVMAPVLAVHLPDIGQQARQIIKQRGSSQTAGQSLLINYLIAGFVLLGVVFSLPWFKGNLAFLGQKAGLLSFETPVEATRAMIREQLPTPVFHDMSFGSYLIWAAHPEYPVFVDPRIELYPTEIWQDYLAISAAVADWEDRLDKYGINTLLLSLENQGPLIEAARESSHWRLVYQAAPAVIFVREVRQ